MVTRILPTLGLVLLALAVLTSLHQTMRPQKAGEVLARNVSLAAQISPFALLVGAFVVDASGIDLVARYGGAGLPLLYRVSAVWGGRAGPLLLWAALVYFGLLWAALECSGLIWGVRGEAPSKPATLSQAFAAYGFKI